MIISYSKSMLLFVGSRFFLSHYGLREPRHFYDLSPLGTMSDHNWRVFHPRGDLSLLVDSRHIFPISCNRATMLDVVLLPSPPNQTPNAVLIYKLCTHTHEMRCFSCICNAKCHCMLSHVTCITNTKWNNL